MSTRIESQSIGTQQTTGGDQGLEFWPPNSEGFYRSQSTQAIIDRIKTNASEQQTFLNAVNHEMDAMAARTTANGGVMSQEDKVRYRAIKSQIGAVMSAFSGPESKAFYDAMWFAKDRAQKANPDDLDYLPMSAQEALTHTQNNRAGQLEFLADMDEELNHLQTQIDNGTADDATLQRYNHLVEKLNLMRDGNTEQPFDDELTERLTRATAGQRSVPRWE